MGSIVSWAYLVLRTYLRGELFSNSIYCFHSEKTSLHFSLYVNPNIGEEKSVAYLAANLTLSVPVCFICIVLR